MLLARLPDLAWKMLLSVMALIAVGLWILEAPEAIRTARTGERGGLDISIEAPPQQWLSRDWVITRIGPESPLNALGVTVGDHVMFDQAWVVWRPGERVGLTLVRQGSSQHVSVVAARLRMETDALFRGPGWWAITVLPAVALGLTIGFRQSRSPACRCLAFAFLCLGLDHLCLNAQLLPTSAARLAWLPSVLAPTVWYYSAAFAVLFPHARPQGVRAVLQRYVLPLHAVLCIGLVIVEMWANTGVYFAGESAGLSVVAIARTAIVVTALVAGWRASTGGLRLRFKWLTLSIGLWTIVAVLQTLEWTVGGLYVGDIAYPPGIALALSLFAYAVLRHRVLDFGFVLNRAAVYTVTSALVLVAFGLAEWTAEHLLHFEHREENIALDAALALGVFLALHRVRDFVEHWIERLLFSQWHLREAELRQFVRRAAHFSDEAALLDAFVVALGRFTRGAGCAIYLQAEDGAYDCARSTLPGAPPRLDANSSAAVALREDSSPLSADTSLLLGTELNLAMSQRGTLSGLVALGPKPTGDSYRPDEQEILAFAARQVGLDIHALRTQALMAELTKLRNRSEGLMEALQLLRGSADSARA